MVDYMDEKALLNIKQEHERLKQLIRQYDYDYYVKSAPSVSDEVYDRLFQRLIELEQQYGHELNIMDSPTQRLTPAFVDHFPKKEHPFPMLSLEKIFNKEDLLRFWKKTAKELGVKNDDELEVCLEPKIDGASLELIYEDGVLKEAVTRGDGRMGDDVTQHAKQIRTIPLTIPVNGKVVVRGEVVIYKRDFEQINKALQSKNEEVFASARNLASGSLHHQNTELVKERRLRFIAYQLLGDVADQCQTQYCALKTLQQWGFLTPLHFPGLVAVANNIEDVQKHYDQVLSNRQSTPFEMDGLTVKVNSLLAQKELGVISRAPRWAVAYKFPNAQAVTQLLGVDFQVGKTGAVTPVAVLRPVKVGDVVVTYASLHNRDEITRLDLHWGDFVVVKRAGDVIPQIESVIYELRPEKALPVQYPTHCPSCGELLFVHPDEAAIRCINPDCPGIRLELLKYWVSKDGIDMPFVGPEIVEALYKKGLVKYRGDFWALIALPQIGEKLAKKILNSIQSKKKIPLNRFIAALAIPNVGERLSDLLAKHFGSWDKFCNATLNDLQSVPGISETIAKSIYGWINNHENKKEVEGIFANGVELITDEYGSGKLSGMTFVLTGEFPVPRSKLEKWIQQNGGQVLSSVSKKTMFLVVGDNPGQTKLSQAEKIMGQPGSNLQVIDWEKFVRMVGYDI